MIFISPKIKVEKSPIHGYGVFAKEFIPSGEILETCHFWILEEKDFQKLDKTIQQISFAYPIFTSDSHAIVLGWGSIYNHSTENNAAWATDTENQLFKFFTVKDINPGEEILTNYLKTTI
jgi:SET domain-containing protein